MAYLDRAARSAYPYINISHLVACLFWRISVYVDADDTLGFVCCIFRVWGTARIAALMSGVGSPVKYDRMVWMKNMAWLCRSSMLNYDTFACLLST